MRPGVQHDFNRSEIGLKGYCGLCSRIELSSLAKPAALAAITNVLVTLPAHADAGKIFDFNLTLPIMATQFLLLMVFLEKTWFTPVGKVLDSRDKLLRDQLGSVKVAHCLKTWSSSTEFQMCPPSAKQNRRYHALSAALQLAPISINAEICAQQESSRLPVVQALASNV